MHKLIRLSVGLLMCCKCLAASPDFEATVSLANQDARSKKAESFNQAKHFNPQTVFDNYTKNPDQTKYYQGIDQKDTQQMDNDKIQSKASESGTVISNSIKQHPNYVISQSDPDIKRSQRVRPSFDVDYAAIGNPN